jgi:hypothetical protein
MKTVNQIISKYKGRILSVKDVKSFFTDLRKLGLSDGFHPDTDLSDYLNQDGNDLFTDSEVYLLSKILKDCFKVCKKEKGNIYEIANKIFKSNRSIEIKKSFDKEMKKVFKLTESFEGLLNLKMKIQAYDYLNWKQVEDMKRTYNILLKAINIMKQK